jgi:hypothetical protein
MMRSQAINEAARLITQSVPDLKRLAALLSIAGGCERIVNELPVKPPKLIRFVGSSIDVSPFATPALCQAVRHQRL